MGCQELSFEVSLKRCCTPSWLQQRTCIIRRQSQRADQTVPDDCLDRLFDDLVDPMRNKLVVADPWNKQTPDTEMVGVRERCLMGVEV